MVRAFCGVNRTILPLPIGSLASLVNEKKVGNTAQIESTALTDLPGTDAPIDNCRSADTLCVENGKSALSAPPVTETDNGIETAASAFERFTVIPPGGAGRVRSTLPRPLPPPMVP